MMCRKQLVNAIAAGLLGIAWTAGNPISAQQSPHPLAPGSVSAVRGQNNLRAKSPARTASAGSGALAANESTAAAQNSAAPDAEDLILQAHNQAKAAATVEEFTEALNRCRDALRQPLSEGRKAYVGKLAAWIYMKRGEKLVGLGEELAAQETARAVEYEKIALSDFNLAVKLDDANWRARYNRGLSYAMIEEYDKSLADLTMVIEQQPNHKDAHYNRGEVHYQLGQLERAIQDYSDTLRLDPQDHAAYSGRGMSYFELGDYSRALADMNAVLKLDPNSAVAFAQRADVFAALGQWERAAADYRVSLKLDKALGRALHNVAWLMATCPDKQFRNGELAVRAARKAIEVDGANFQYLDTLAAALASAGKFEEARSVAQKALQASPAEEQAGIRQRLALYEASRPYRDAQPSVSDSRVRLASGQEELAEPK